MGRITTSSTTLPIHQSGHRGLLSATIAALRGDARQRAEDDVELRVDRLDRGLERAQVLGLDALERAGERGEALRDPRRPRRTRISATASTR